MLSRFLRTATLIALATLLSQVQGPAAQTPEVRALKDVMVPMRDGVRLATDVYLPPGDGPFPVLLARTPYDKGALAGMGMATQKYAMVIQDVRGRFKSEGRFIPFLAEGKDGYDTIEWCARQPWCNGKVGMIGGSYVGFVQYLAAMEQPPHLRCIMPVVSLSSMRDACYQGGELRQELIQGWMIAMAASSQYAAKHRAPDRPEWAPDRWFRHMPIADPGPLVRGGPDYVQAWRMLVNPSTHAPLWNQLDLGRAYQRIQVPVLAVGGWFDIFCQGNLDNWAGVRAKGGTEAARRYSKLIMGPWTHGVGAKPGDRDFGPEAGIDQGALISRWFGHWLLGEQNGVENDPPLRTFTMGPNRWVNRTEWPPRNARPVRFYLSNPSGSPKQGTLQPTPPARQSPTEYVYDPDDPVPTHGGNNLVAMSGVRDQLQVESRSDVLLFTSPPLTHDVEVAGRMSAILYVTSTAPDTDFTAKLVDVLPDGTAYNVADGIARAATTLRGRKLSPRRPVSLQVDLWSTSMVFPTGHRIRLEVSSSNFPRFSRNPNTGQSPLTARRTAKARNSVYHGGANASYLLLPVVGGKGL